MYNSVLFSSNSALKKNQLIRIYLYDRIQNLHVHVFSPKNLHLRLKLLLESMVKTYANL